MKISLFIRAALSAVVFFLLLSGTTKSQQYDFETSPYDSSYTDLMSGSGVSADSILEILTFSRPGKKDIDMVFLRGQFYLICDLGGDNATYIFSYFDDVADYLTELNLNGISASSLSSDQLLGGVLRYYNKP